MSQMPVLYLAQDFAEELQVQRDTIYRYTNEARNGKGDFPTPDGYLGRTPYWLEETVQKYVEQRVEEDE